MKIKSVIRDCIVIWWCNQKRYFRFISTLN